MNRVDPTGMEWYTKAGGSSNDYFFIKDQSDDPYYSGTQRYNLAGETVSKWLGDDLQFTHYQNGDEDGSISDWYSPDPPNVTTTAINLSLVRTLYSNSGDIGGNCNNYAPVRSGNSGQNSSGQNGDNRLSKLPATVGAVTDMLNTAGASIKMAIPVAENGLRIGLTRPTSVVGAMLTGGPALYDIIFDKGWDKSENWINLAIAGGAVALEYSGGGEIIDGVSILYSAGTVIYDLNNLNNEHK